MLDVLPPVPIWLPLPGAQPRSAFGPSVPSAQLVPVPQQCPDSGHPRRSGPRLCLPVPPPSVPDLAAAGGRPAAFVFAPSVCRRKLVPVPQQRPGLGDRVDHPKFAAGEHTAEVLPAVPDPVAPGGRPPARRSLVGAVVQPAPSTAAAPGFGHEIFVGRSAMTFRKAILIPPAPPARFARPGTRRLHPTSSRSRVAGTPTHPGAGRDCVRTADVRSSSSLRGREVGWTRVAVVASPRWAGPVWGLRKRHVDSGFVPGALAVLARHWRGARRGDGHSPCSRARDRGRRMAHTSVAWAR